MARKQAMKSRSMKGTKTKGACEPLRGPFARHDKTMISMLRRLMVVACYDPRDEGASALSVIREPQPHLPPVSNAPFPGTSLDTARYRSKSLNTNSNKPCYREGGLKPNRNYSLAGQVPNCNILNKHSLKSTNVYYSRRSRSES